MSDDPPPGRPRPRPRPTHDVDVPPPVEPAGAPEPEADAPSPRAGRSQRHAGLIAVVAGTLAVAVAVVLVVLLVQRGHASSSSADTADPLARLQDASQAQAFVAGAASDIAAITSYSYRTLQSDLYNGEAVSTGAFRTRYRAALTGSLGAAAKRLHRTQSFELAAAGIGSVADGGRQAHVLIFGTQSVEDDTTDGRTDDSLLTLDVTVQRSGDSYLVSDLEVGGDAGLPPGSAGLAAAAEAAKQEIQNLLTMRRAHAAADAQALVAGAVGSLRTQLRTQSSALRRAVSSGGYDLTGEVTAVAVQDAAGNTATMLVAATGDKTTASASSSVVTDGRYQVVVVRVQGQWLVSAITPIAVG